MSAVRKSGVPKLSMEYAQSLIFLDEFSNLTFLMSIAIQPKGFFQHTPLLISAALFLSIEFKKILDQNPNTPVLSNSKVKEWVVKGSAV